MLIRGVVSSPVRVVVGWAFGGGPAVTPATWSASRLGDGLAIADSPDNTITRRTGADNWTSVGSTDYKSEGKWYFEVRSTAAGSYLIAGIGNSSALLTTYAGNTNSSSVARAYTGNIYVGNSGGIESSGYAALAANDVLQCAVDAATKRVWWRKGGTATWEPSGDPAAGTGGQDCSGLSGTIAPFASIYVSGDIILNAGQEAFVSTPPSGFSAWSQTV